MPIIESTYKPSFIFKNRHLSTAIASKLRKVPQLNFKRERIELRNKDFIDIDWNLTGSKKVLIVVHGLGGYSTRTYMRAIIKKFEAMGFDSAAMNMRGCSGETNRLIETYHAGRSEDLREVINAIRKKKKYNTFVLAGFSLGGNLILKYLGEEGSRAKIDAAIAISSPIDLVASSIKMSGQPFYMKYFFKKLRPYLEKKQKLFPQISLENFEKLKTFDDYDNRYTAPLNGFKNAKDYWVKASALPFIKSIKVPTLMINALDDPILTEKSYPVKFAKSSKNFYLCTPQYGGHVGFIQKNDKHEFYQEEMSEKFLKLINLI